MSKWVIKSSKVTRAYGLESEALMTAGTFSVDEKTGDVLVVVGSCYRVKPDGSQGDLVGTFNGQCVDGKLEYSLSKMGSSDVMAVLDAIHEIEQHIINND